jgi:threonine aldolase
LPGGPLRAKAQGKTARRSFFESELDRRLLRSARSISKIDMNSRAERHDFASDNTAPICPEALAALQEANSTAAASYGDDRWTARLCQQVRELFETDCEVFLVFNGTAANALALSQMCQSFHSVICHEQAHIHTDECGAPEFFTKGSKLLLVGGDNGKIDIVQAEAVMAKQPEVHAHKPRAISITQATEFGAVYTRDEIAAVAELARRRNLLLHMDGARFANAMATLDCRPREITWGVGVDVLCFGGTKNGLAAGELVIFFKQELAREFDYRVKQVGQLGSKMRFLAAPWTALLTGDVWLQNARRANAAAGKLADRLKNECKIDIVHPVESNAVFVQMREKLVRDLHARGWSFYRFVEPDIYRLMCSWATTDDNIAEFVVDFQNL